MGVGSSSRDEGEGGSRRAREGLEKDSATRKLGNGPSSHSETDPLHNRCAIITNQLPLGGFNGLAEYRIQLNCASEKSLKAERKMDLARRWFAEINLERWKLFARRARSRETRPGDGEVDSKSHHPQLRAFLGCMRLCTPTLSGRTRTPATDSGQTLGALRERSELPIVRRFKRDS